MSFLASERYVLKDMAWYEKNITELSEKYQRVITEKIRCRQRPDKGPGVTSDAETDMELTLRHASDTFCQLICPTCSLGEVTVMGPEE